VSGTLCCFFVLFLSAFFQVLIFVFFLLSTNLTKADLNVHRLGSDLFFSKLIFVDANSFLLVFNCL
jgi:hypothetical protein